MSGVFSALYRCRRRLSAGCLLAAALSLSACRDATDAFFAGRPSDMAMAHNKALDGSVEAMRELLAIPARFPQANETHYAQWQESPIAWWLAPGGRDRILAALARLTPAERDALAIWLAKPEPYGQNKQQAMAELRLAVATAQAGGPGAAK